MNKGHDTKLTILQTALEMASELGLEAVTIGELAKATGMSKSGLFAHFQSKENLQVAILQFAAQKFSADVVSPALKNPAGIARIKALIEKWVGWTSDSKGGCIFVSASTEFSDRPGKVRELLLKQQQDWIESLRRIGESAIKSGDFHPDADCEQFAFEAYSLMLGFHLYSILLHSEKSRERQFAALEKLLDQYR